MSFNPDLGSWNILTGSLITDGFWPLDLELMWSPAPQVYSNPVDSDEVSLARRPVVTDAVHDIRFRLSGIHLFDGGTAANIAEGFKENYDELRARVGTPSTWGGPSVATTVVDPLGTSYSGQIQPRVLSIGRESGPVANTIVVVTIIGGELAAVA